MARGQRAVVGLDPPPVPLRGDDRAGRPGHVHRGAVLVQVRRERGPDAGQVVGVGRVEADALGVSEEVVVEHRDQLARGQRPRLREERAGEGLEQHRLCPVRHAEPREELRGRHVVEQGGGPLPVVRQQLGGEPGVGAEQVAQAEAGGAGEQREQVQRRRRRQPRQVFGRPRARQHGVAPDRTQEAQLRVDPAQHVAPGVVVPEERMEAVLDDLVRAVRQRVRPRPEAPAERGCGFEQGDGDPPLRQHDRRADPGDPSADDDGLGAVRGRARQPRVCGDDDARPHPQRRGAGAERGGAEHAVEPRCAAAASRSHLPRRARQRRNGCSESGVRCAQCTRSRFRYIGRPRPGGRNAQRAGEVAADMTVELGRIGIWRRRDQLTPRLAKEVEALGYGAVWIGGSPPADLFLAEELLDATTRLAVATGIVNMWSAPATEVAASHHRVAAAHPGRFLLGVGIGHPEATQEYRSPYDTIVDYLDVLDAEGVPVEDRALAALGPKVLALAAERTAGAHPYLTTPEHTRDAREILGDGPLLAPEQKVVLDTDPVAARALGRPAVDQPYLHLRNYTSNLKRLGWTDADIADGGSDALIDALALHGDAATVAAGVTAHLDAGADHVCIQLLTAPGADPLPGLRALAEALELG